MASERENCSATRYWPQSIVEILAEAQNLGWSADLPKLWQVHVLVARLFAGRYRGSGRPFINHLAGTASLAMRHGAGLTEVLAAYGHAAYEQGDFGRARTGASKANRAEVRRVVGDAAELLIADYVGSDWARIAERRDTADLSALSSHERKLMFLYIVNELDDSFDHDVYAAEWREESLNRMAAGARLALVLLVPSLAAHLGDRIAQLQDRPALLPQHERPKRSETILNSSSRLKMFLRLERKLVRISDKLRG